MKVAPNYGIPRKQTTFNLKPLLFKKEEEIEDIGSYGGFI